MNTAYFLINTIFDLYLMVVLLRVWLQWARADFYNPMSQMVVKVTNPLVIPLRRIIPGIGGLDWSTVFAAFALQLLPDFVGTVDLMVGSPDAFDVRHQHRIALRPSTQQFRVTLAGRMAPIG